MSDLGGIIWTLWPGKGSFRNRTILHIADRVIASNRKGNAARVKVRGREVEDKQRVKQRKIMFCVGQQEWQTHV